MARFAPHDHRRDRRNAPAHARRPSPTERAAGIQRAGRELEASDRGAGEGGGGEGGGASRPRADLRRRAPDRQRQCRAGAVERAELGPQPRHARSAEGVRRGRCQRQRALSLALDRAAALARLPWLLCAAGDRDPQAPAQAPRRHAADARAARLGAVHRRLFQGRLRGSEAREARLCAHADRRHGAGLSDHHRSAIDRGGEDQAPGVSLAGAPARAGSLRAGRARPEEDAHRRRRRHLGQSGAPEGIAEREAPRLCRLACLSDQRPSGRAHAECARDGAHCRQAGGHRRGLVDEGDRRRVEPPEYRHRDPDHRARPLRLLGAARRRLPWRAGSTHPRPCHRLAVAVLERLLLCLFAL